MKTFVQIGIGASASYVDLIKHGWKGTLVEVHPHAFASAVKQVHRDFTEEEIANLSLVNAAISDRNGFDVVQTANLFGVDPWCGLETSNEHNDRFHTSDRFRSDRYSFLSYAISLETLLPTDYPVELLSMDIQGSELKALRGLFAKPVPRPSLIDVECHSQEAREGIADLLYSNEYELMNTHYQYHDKGRPNDIYASANIQIVLSDAEKAIIPIYE